MPIKTLAVQRRSREIGRIRLGAQVPTERGRPRPIKLDTFRLTTASQRIAEAAAALLGGQARPWTTAPTAGQWEVITGTDTIPVAIPPGATAMSQWMEMWSGGGCARRCDGEHETLSKGPCLCPSDVEQRTALAADGEACKPTTRVNVIIPGLPDIGVWRVESHGHYAAVELGGTADMLAQAGAQGIIVPAVLRLEQRQTKTIRGGRATTRNYGVPVLEVLWSLHQMLEAAGQGGSALAQALPAASAGLAITAAPAAAPARDRHAEPQRMSRPQEVVPEVLACTNIECLREFVKGVQRREWMDAMVVRPGDEAEGILSRLADVFAARAEQIGGGR